MSEDRDFDVSEYFKEFDRGMNEPQAFYVILAAAVVSDGIADKREEEELEALAHRCVTLTQYAKDNEKDYNKLQRDTHAKIDDLKTNQDALMQWALESARDAAATLRRSEKPDSICYSAYAHAVDIILADAKVQNAEMEFLNALKKALQLANKDAAEILSTLTKKNKH